jgi:glycosyltransferase involved in cell wall biosynthesis
MGDGTERKALEKLSQKLGLESAITFLGTRNYQEAIGLIKATDIFVNPSYSEGLPTTVVEAALAKKAIIATDIGGTEEIIEDQKSGFLIEPHDPERLKEKIELLIENKELRIKLGDNAFAASKNKFDQEKNSKKIEFIIREKINGQKNSENIGNNVGL